MAQSVDLILFRLAGHHGRRTFRAERGGPTWVRVAYSIGATGPTWLAGVKFRG